jgi:hypothetical protein
VHYIPLRADTYGTGFEAMLMNGLLAAAGLALIVPLFIPSRWRSRPGATNPANAAQVPEPTASTLLASDDWTQTATYPTNDPWDGTNRE